MKIEIFKQQNDENIYFKVGEETKTLNFENLKIISKNILDEKLLGKILEIEVTSSDPALDLYKTTVTNVFSSINNDNDLFNLYESIKSNPIVQEEPVEGEVGEEESIIISQEDDPFADL